MQTLGLEYLQYADGLAESQRREEEEKRHAALLDTLVRASLVASGTYEEKLLFRDYFPADELPDGISATSDADVDLDYSGVDFGTPDENEMEILQRMLEDKSVTVSGLGTPDEPEPAAPDLPAPREIAFTDIDQDREWV